MPMYDYNCPKCGRNEESILVGFNDTVVCDCGNIMMRAFPSPSVIIPPQHQSCPSSKQPRPLGR